MNYKKFMILMLIIIGSSVWFASANINKNAVFEPDSYEKAEDSPDDFENNFSVPYSEGNFTRHLQNDRDEDHKIRGDDKKRHEESLENEHKAPVIEINFPINNAYHPVKVPLDGTPVILKTVVVGTIKGNVENATLKVNSDIFDVHVINGSFYQNVTLNESANRISVLAVDTFGNTGKASIVAYVENTNAELKIPVPPPSPFENEKLGAGLNYTFNLYETRGINAAVAFLRRDPNNIIENRNIRVRIPIPEEKEIYINALKSIGINVLYVTNATDIGGEIEVHAFLPISGIRKVGELQFVKRIYVESKPSLESITEGDAIINGDKVKNLGFTGLKPDGSPVKIGVIDDSGTSHEAKVIEVIRSIAPNALITNYSGDWDKAINNATMKGVNIISVSQSAPWLDLDGTDYISDQIKTARLNNKVLYINAAGNYANLHYKGTYQDNNRNGWHEFASDTKGYDETLDAEWSFLLDSDVTAYLHVNPADFDKLDIKVGVNNTGVLPTESLTVSKSRGVKSIVASTGNLWDRNLSDIRFFVVNSSKYNSSEVIGTPFHIFVYPNPKSLSITKIELDKQHQWIDNPVKESSIPAPATSRYSFTVGATYSDLIESSSDAAIFLGVNNLASGNIPASAVVILSALTAKYTFPQDGLAYFSGQGPVYDAAGNTIIKPDVVAPTFVSTEHGIFGGTSASAPHAAGAAALLLSANPSLSADQLQMFLEESSLDLGDADKDNKYGAGRINVYEAVKRVTPDLQPSNIQVIQDSTTKEQNVIIKADVRNSGYWEARNIEVQFFKNGTIINTTIIPILKAGDMTTIESTCVPEGIGSYNISVSVDPGNRIPEFNESNNYANKTISLVWLDGWDYRRKLTINGTTAGVQKNYQMKVIIYKGSGTDSAGTAYLGGNVRDDFADLRFTKSDGVTLLDYWIESYISGVSAVVWVEIDSIPASPDKADIYFYYGNSMAIGAGNGAATFEFFEDFSGDLSRWSETDPDNIGNIVDGHYEVYGGSRSTFYMDSLYVIPRDRIVEFNMELNRYSSAVGLLIRASSDSEFSVIGRGDANKYSRFTIRTRASGFDYDSAGVITPRSFRVVWKNVSTDDVEFWYLDSGTWVEWQPATIKTYNKAGTHKLRIGYEYYDYIAHPDSSETFKFDNIRIRKYTNPEPTW